MHFQSSNGAGAIVVEISFNIEIIKFALGAAAVVYIVYGLEGMILFKKDQESRDEDIVRIILSFSLAAYSLIILIYTIMPFSQMLNKLFLPTAFLWATFNTFLYVKFLRDYILWARYIIPFIKVCSAIALFLSAYVIIITVTSGESPGWQFIEDQTISNRFHLATFGHYRYEPKVIGLAISVVGLFISTCAFVGLVSAIFQGLNKDRFLIFGIFFSLIAMIGEIVVPLLLPAYMFPIYFATNLPEIIRISFLSRRKLMVAAINKERETLALVSGTMRHELNTPLAILRHSIELSRRKNDFQKLDLCDAAIDDISKIILKIDNLSKSQIQTESYRSNINSSSSVAKIYSI